MSTRRWKTTTVGALSALALFFGIFAFHKTARAASQSAAKTEPSTTEKDQVDLNITVYNSNLALVRDVRQIHLESGVFPLKFEDVAASINPTTVHFRSLSDPAKLSVVEQNYEYDLLDAQKLLQKYVGREVTLVRGEEDANSTKWVETRALLLADNNGQPVWKIGDEIVTGMPTNWYRFADLPGNLYSRPTLVWTLENRGADAQRVEASYLTGNVSWSADYVLTVARDEKNADLDGWVTLTNGSGVEYRNAKLQLVAGEIHQVAPPVSAKAMDMARVEATPAAQPQFCAGSVLRISPVHARAPHVDREQRIETDQPAQRDRPFRGQAPRSRGPDVLLPQSPGDGKRHPGDGEGLLPIQKRTGQRPRHAATGGNRARLSSGFEGRHAIRRRRSNQSHTKGRTSANLRRQCIRRGLRTQANRLPENQRRHL